MKLHANIDDMALIVKDLLPRDLFLQVADFDFASVKDKKRQDSLIDWPRELYVDDTPENNRTMESVKTVINLAVCLKGEYEFVDPIFKEVLDIIKGCEYIPFKDNSSLVLNYYEYAKHAGINWHTDQDIRVIEKPKELVRKLSFTLQLSDENEYTGGNLEFADFDDSKNKFIAPRTRGCLIVFDSRVPHRVCPVKSGLRKSLVGWVMGKRWR